VAGGVRGAGPAGRSRPTPKDLAAAGGVARSEHSPPLASAYRAPTPASVDLKRCTKCGEEKPRAEFSRDRSRKDGRAPWCKACVRCWHQENAEHLADYHRRWQQANPEKKRAQNRRYRERKREDPESS
jgi:hypothetical protein